MSAILDYMRLCRLCLVKDKVNVPIFGEASDVRQIFLKITACLPVKVSEEDNLPKSICDSCMYKVDLLYQFWNTTVNAEKQLIQWLAEIGVDVNIKNTSPPNMRILPQSHAHPHSMPEAIILKEERPDPETKSMEQNQNYQDSQHMYADYEMPYQPQVNMTVGAPTDFSQPTDAPAEEEVKVPQQKAQPTKPTPAKRRGRPPKQKTPPVVKLPPPVVPPAATSTATGSKRRSSAAAAAAAVAAAAANASSDESDLDDRFGGDDSDDEDMDVRIAKEEADSEDEEYVDNPESLEPTAFVGVPSTSACDSEQPGPSGLGGSTTTGKTSSALPASAANESGCDNNNFFGQPDAIKFPFPVWDNNNQKSEDCYGEKLTIKVEPLDINWDDEDLTLMDLKNKMGLAPKKKRKQRTAKTNPKTYRSQKQPCILCGSIIRGRSALVNHYLVHKESKIKSNLELINKYGDEDFFRCCVCMKEFVTKPQLDKHSEYHVQRPFFCEKCNKSFKQTQNFIFHMDSHRSNTELKCNTCDFTTTFKLAFDKHVKSHARQEYKCDECDKVFPARTWFLEHKNFHTGERPFSCEECGKCFPYSRYLTAHKKSMHPHCYFKEPEINECAICQKRYSHKNSLRLHMKVHTGENTYLCDICGKRLSSTDKLQLHRRIHTGYKPYACTVCEKRFTKKDILTDHLRTHSGEKPFACETCGKCFSQRSPLTIHRRYHTGERPYVCHLCNKGFVSKGILGIHLKQGKH